MFSRMSLVAVSCGLILLICVEGVAGQVKPAGSSPERASVQDSGQESARRQRAYLRFIEAQRLKGEAQRQRSTKFVEEAIKAYEETIALDPTAAEPHVDLGELYFFYLSRRDLAEREGLEAVRLDPKSVGGHLLLARLYISSWKMENAQKTASIERALVEYEKVAELDPGRAEAWALLSELYQIKNNTERQIFALEKWAGAPIASDEFFYRWLMNRDLSAERAYLQLSRLYYGEGRNQAATEAARRAYEANPEDSEFARNLINILRAAGSGDDELRIYARLVKTAKTPTLLIGYGSALVRAGRYEEAIKQLSEYLELDRTNASAMALLAIALRRANQRPAAVETLKAGLARVDKGTRVDLILQLGETYEELGRNDEAIAQYEQAFEGFLGKDALTPINKPLFGEVVNRLTRVCLRSGNQTKLQSVLTRTRRVLDEHDPLLDLMSIEAMREEGKRQAALELARAATRRNPDDRALKFTEAIILTEMKKFAEAKELLAAMIRDTPDNATEDAGVYLILSSVEMQSGDLKRAEATAQKALALNPDDPDILIQLASVLDRARRYEEAEKILQNLIKRDQDNATALNNLGYFLIERGERVRFQEALGLIQRAIAIEPINGSFLDSLGWAYFKLGDSGKALESLEKAAIYSRRNPTIHEHLGDVLLQMGRIAEARRQWEKALEYSFEADEIARIKVKLKNEQ